VGLFLCATFALLGVECVSGSRGSLGSSQIGFWVLMGSEGQGMWSGRNGRLRFKWFWFMTQSGREWARGLQMCA
jgi:hypothetical protein